MKADYGYESGLHTFSGDAGSWQVRGMRIQEIVRRCFLSKSTLVFLYKAIARI